MSSFNEEKIREILRKVLGDHYTRIVCLKPLYDSEDLGVCLIKNYFEEMSDTKT